MKRHVVIAEDSLSTRERLARIVSRLGYNVFKAEDGQIAWERIEGNALDLLITDIGMPNLDGYGLINSLTKGGYEMPIIVFAGRFDHSKVSGYNGRIVYFSKPLVDESALLQKVQELAPL